MVEVPKGEIDHGAYAGHRSPAHRGGDLNGGGVDADGPAAVVDGGPNFAPDLVRGELRLEDGMVDVGGQFGGGHLCCGLGGLHGALLFAFAGFVVCTAAMRPLRSHGACGVPGGAGITVTCLYI